MFGDDCERPSCDDIKKVLPKSMEEMEAMSKRAKQRKQQTNSTATTKSMVACPLRSAELGKSSWNLLHSMVAWYPDKPTRDQQVSMTNFMSGLAEFYPCTWCAADFQDNIQETPPKTKSREELCQWMCAQHNIVNEKLGKPSFQCDMKTLDERWRKSNDPKCNTSH